MISKGICPSLRRGAWRAPYQGNLRSAVRLSSAGISAKTRTTEGERRSLLLTSRDTAHARLQVIALSPHALLA